jgi:hypothetical protein
MTATKTQLTGGNFQDAEGNILANGYLKMKLSQDGTVTGVANVVSGVEITIQLDSDGNVASSASTPTAADQYVWGNDNLLPVNTYYRVTGYTVEGQPAWGPNNQQVEGSSPFDVGTWIPNQVISWVPPVQIPTLEVNGTPNVNQKLLNLESLDSSAIITDEGNGSVNIEIPSTAVPIYESFQNVHGFSCAAGTSLEGGNGLGMVPTTGSSVQQGGPTATEGATYQLAASSGIYLTDAHDGISVGSLNAFWTRFGLQRTTLTRSWVCIAPQSSVAGGGLSSDTPSFAVVGFRFSPTNAGDTTWMFYASPDGSSVTVGSTGVVPDTDLHDFRIVQSSAGVFDFYIDGTKVGTVSTHIPVASTAVSTSYWTEPTDGSSTNFQVGYGWWVNNF